MDESVLATIFEVNVAIFLVMMAYKWPKITGAAALVAAVGLGSHFFDRSLATPISGTHIVDYRTTMTAAFFLPGAPHDVEVSQSVPIPPYRTDSQMFVKIIAAGLNPSNFKINFAKIPFLRHMSKYHRVGYDFVGIVESVGSADTCRRFSNGDKVYGMAFGSMAEYTIASCSTVGHAPKHLTDVQIAGLPVAALTSMEALRRGGISENMHVLVVGASGGCGVFGVTLAKLLGAHVTGICSGRNAEFVRSLGVDRVVEYTDTVQMDALITEGQQFDIVYDTVTSFSPEDPDYEVTLRPLLRVGGKYEAINGSPLDWVRGVVDKFVVAPLLGRAGYMQRQRYDLFLLTPTQEMLNTLTEYFDTGLLRDVPIDSTFFLDRDGVHAAFDKIKGRRSVGKIVITVE